MADRANSTSWNSKPFGDVIELPYEESFSDAEFARIQLGLIPQVMEDKWFCYFDDNTLFFHRSWTGIPVFRVHFDDAAGIVNVSKAYLSSDIQTNDFEYQARLLEFLISNLLLGKSLPFPRQEHSADEPIGLMQHVFSGTGYPEITQSSTKKRCWWAFWRK